MQTKIIERYFFFGLLLATLVFTFFIFKPFWIVLVLGTCFAIVLYPIYEWFKNRKLPDWFSAFLTVFFFAIIICGPLFGIGVIVFNQSQDVYYSIVNSDGSKVFLNSINNKVNDLLPSEINFNANEKASSLISFISNNVAKIFSTTLSTILSFFLMLLTIFYLLKDGARWRKALVKLSPLADADDHKIISRLTQTINGVLKGYLLVALAQGTLMGIGLAIFGVPNPALWGVIAAIVSVIPTVGTTLVSLPAIIFLFLTGHLGGAIGLLIWSVGIVSLIDNILNPFLIGKKINIPPFLILFAVLGGVVLLGPIGLLMGPLVLSLLYTLVSIYRNEFKGVVL